MTISSDPLVIFLPSGKRGNILKGTTVLDAARKLNVDLDSVCGGLGICSKCQISPALGNFPKFGIECNPTALTEKNAVEARYDKVRGLKSGRRLGCQAKITENIVIDIPSESQLHKQIIRKEANKRPIKMAPATKLFYIEVEEPNIEIPLGDYERVQESLKKTWNLKNVEAPLSLIQTIQSQLRGGDWKLTCAIFYDIKTKKNIILETWQGYFSGSIYGVALDLGSTTIAGHLCDLQNGNIISSSGLMNPQIKFGEDLMSRVSYAMMNIDGCEKLSSAVRNGINKLLEEICTKAKISKELVLELIIVGNPIMHHLLLGIDPTELGQAPFALAISQPVSFYSYQLNLNLNKNTQVSILPCIAGHVGADAAAVVLSETPNASKDVVLIVDVGTNAEILLRNKDQLFACSSPTGPAFEGAQISCGQRAAPGAIEKVRINLKSREVIFKVIGSKYWSNHKKFSASLGKLSITGICGSGIIEAVAEMRLAGVLDATGLIGSKDQTGSSRCLKTGRTNSFLLYKSSDGESDILVSNADVRAIQLAKAALFSGAKILMEEMGVAKVDRIILAGAFGSHISPRHAMILGMIPDCDLKKVTSAGNAAGTGARIALHNFRARKKIAKIVSKIHKIETAVAARFQTHFVAASNIPNSNESFSELRKTVNLPSVNFNQRDKKRSRRGN